MLGKQRGVGYCVNRECDSYAVLHALLDLPSVFQCATCGQSGQREWERVVRSGRSDLCEEIRVEFDFDPERSIYRKRISLNEPGLLGRHDICTLQTPLVRTQGSALKVAEVALSSLNGRLFGSACEPRLSSRDDLIDQGWPVLV